MNAAQALAALSVKKTTCQKDPEKIQAMFQAVAKKYDLTNAALSFNIHRYWNKCLAKALKEEDSLLDLCSGTGDIAYKWLELQTKAKTAVLLDFCEGMLEEAKTKKAAYIKKGHAISFIQADASATSLPSSSTHAASIAYGIRNIQDPFKCFQEVYRVLKPSGTFAILELTEPTNPLLKYFHGLYLNHILPFLGGLITREKKAYRYLSKSIQNFSKPETIQKELIAAGFKDVTFKRLTGGIATLFIAKKP